MKLRRIALPAKGVPFPRCCEFQENNDGQYNRGGIHQNAVGLLHLLATPSLERRLTFLEKIQKCILGTFLP
jgi:hypothetical protein